MYWYKRPWAYFYLFLARLFVCFPPLTPLFILRKCSILATVNCTTTPSCTRESEGKSAFRYWHLFWFSQFPVYSWVNLFGPAPGNCDWEGETSSGSGQGILLLAEKCWWLLNMAFPFLPVSEVLEVVRGTKKLVGKMLVSKLRGKQVR